METETKNELILLVESSGIEKTKGEIIAQTLGQFFAEAAKWNATIESLQITDPKQTGKMKMAREGRLTLKGKRLEAAKIVKSERERVKNLMADFTLEDKLWLKALQMIEATFENLEGKLEEKEKFAERWEAELKAKGWEPATPDYLGESGIVFVPVDLGMSEAEELAQQTYAVR